MVFDELPKVEEASIIQPTYNSGSVVKASDNEYNIYNTIPNIMESVKDASFEDVEPTITVVEEKKPVTNVNINVEDVKVDDSVITDDQFFDDFFGDD